MGINTDNFECFITDGSNSSSNVQSPDIQSGEWVQGAMVVDRDADTLTVYANGVSGTASDISSITGAISPVTIPRIGNDTLGSGIWSPGWFDGRISEILIYLEALSQSDIEKYVFYGIYPDDTNLELHLRHNGNALDSSGN